MIMLNIADTFQTFLTIDASLNRILIRSAPSLKILVTTSRTSGINLEKRKAPGVL